MEGKLPIGGAYSGDKKEKIFLDFLLVPLTFTADRGFFFHSLLFPNENVLLLDIF